ncbi:MAG: bifunctional riboflavin kinase/FAD synthetase, partial [Rhodospirillaceae bacterium]|nr:bifunctional riboflavin kinase/FAD synthetase [Rhodospirillaceae bacterium]
MRIIRHHAEVPEVGRGAAVAIGNFDGVHLGHQAVIAQAARIARAQGLPFGVLTFEPHPRAFFQPDLPPFRLTPFRIKARQLEAMGVEHLVVLHFDGTLAAKSAETFVAEVLGEGLAVAHVIVGYDFVFGRGRRGNAALLRELGARHGFATTTVPAAATADGEVYSSTRIREHLRAGRPQHAARLLGRPWEIEGRVEHGERLGRRLGFPTANLTLGEYLEPARGIYAVKAGIDEGVGTRWRDGVASLGTRPTVGGTQLQLEVHLFDFAGDLYGHHLRVAFIDHLRPEVRFPSLEALAAQIAADAEAARAILASWRGPQPGAGDPSVPPPGDGELET